MRVVFSNRAYASVLAETTERIKTETGGLFLGTVQDDTWYIIEAIDPGPNSIFEVAYFEYDQKYTQHLINKIANFYEKKLDLIGLWHRHPGSFDQFSSTDDGTNSKYASMRKEGAISALVNIDPKFRLTMYHVDKPCRYRKISYDVGDNLIPDELLRYKTPERFYSLMDKILSSDMTNDTSNSGYHKSISLESFMKFILPQIKDEEITCLEIDNTPYDEAIEERIIDEIIDDVTFMADSVGVETSILLEDNYLTVYQEAIDKTTKLHFIFSTEKDALVLSYDNKCFIYRKGLFTEAYGKEKAERDTNKASDSRSKQKNQARIISLFNVFGFNRDEE